MIGIRQGKIQIFLFTTPRACLISRTCQLPNLDYSFRYNEHSLALDDSTNESINPPPIIILACRA